MIAHCVLSMFIWALKMNRPEWLQLVVGGFFAICQGMEMYLF